MADDQTDWQLSSADTEARNKGAGMLTRGTACSFNPMDKYQNQEQDRRLSNIEESVKTINSEMGEVKIGIQGIKTDNNWLKWYVKLTAGAAISGLIIGIINLIMK